MPNRKILITKSVREAADRMSLYDIAVFEQKPGECVLFLNIKRNERIIEEVTHIFAGKAGKPTLAKNVTVVAVQIRASQKEVLESLVE